MMDAQQTGPYKQKLEELRAMLERELAELKKPTEMGDEIDALDTEADEAEEFSANAGMAQSVAQRHEDVIVALGKIGQGTYGVCEKCHEAMEPALLAVNPESRLCKNCKAH